jgi:hypothetical protein
LKRVSKSDAFKEATRTYETFGLGSFATWVNTEDGISAASDKKTRRKKTHTLWVKITNMPTKIKFVANALNSY